MGSLVRRTTDLIKGLTSLALIAGLVVGLPAALVTMAGWPLPTTAPSLDLAQRHITDGDIPPEFVIKLMAVLAWAMWAQLTVSLLVDLTSIITGRVLARVPALPGIRQLAAKLATSLALLVAAFQPTRPAVASTLTPLAAVTAPVEPHTGPTAAPAPVGMGTLYLTSDDQLVDGPAAAGQEYATREGDSWWLIAEQLLGDGFRWAEIRDLNLDRAMPDGQTIRTTTEIIQPGWPLLVPPEAQLPHTGHGDETGPEQATVTVKPGDHLWKVAHRQLTETLGREPTDTELTAYWADLVAANRDHLTSRDPDLIYPDEQLVVPTPPTVPPPTSGHEDPAPGTVPSEETDPDNTGSGTETAEAADAESETSTTETSSTTDASTPTTEPSSVTASATTNGSTPTSTPTTDRSPSTTTTHRPPSTEAQALGPDSQQPSDLPARLATVAGIGIAGTAVGGGALMVLLRWRRQYQAARRRPGDPVEPATDPAQPHLAAFEARVRKIADSRTARWLIAANHLLTDRLEADPDHPLPVIVAVWASPVGVELLLDEACPPLDGFLPDPDDPAIWRVDYQLDLNAIEAQAGDTHPYSPCLLPVGETPGGDLLLDFETLGNITITGDPGTIGGWLSSLAVAASTMTWARYCEVVAIGLDTTVGDLPGLIVPADPDAWAERTATAMTATVDGPQAPPRELRARHRDQGEIYHPALVFVGPGYDDVAEHLHRAAADPIVPLVLVAASPSPTGTTIHLEPGHGEIEPLGIEFVPATTEAPAVQATADLLHATATDADRHGSRPRPDEAISTDEGRVEDPTPATELLPAAASQDDTEPVGRPDAELEPGDPPFVLSDNGDTASHDTNGRSGPPTGASEASVPATDPGELGADAEQEIADLLAPQPIEIEILTPQPAVTGCDPPLPAKPAAVVAYLAYRGSAPSARIRDEFWPESTNRATFDNAMTKIRRSLGTSSAGEPRLVYDRQTQAYRLGDGIGSDWRRVEHLIALADRADGPADEIAYLSAAVGMISGRPGDDAPSKNYNWLCDDHETYSRIEATLTDTAHRLSELALQAGAPDLARWAAERGLTVVPAQEALHRVLMRAAHQAGEHQRIETVYRAARRAAEAFSPWEDTDNETDHLYHRLTGRRPRS